MSAFPEADELFMRRAIDLAMRGRGAVEPNPMVGCVIVRDGRVIGEGYHQKFGEPHAEPNALANCTESPASATAYVTLEPCCHIAKKTKPCVPELIKAGLARIVIGCLDPNLLVTKQCSEKLRSAGIQVDVGCLEVECKQLIAPFFSTTALFRPYVTLKWAQTADGKIAGAGGARLQISNEASTRAVHELRSHSDGILVSIKTVLADDPLLTARIPNPAKIPTRMVLDRDLKIPLSSRLVQTAREIPLVVYCSEESARHAKKIRELDEHRVEVYPLPANSDGSLSLSHVLRSRLPCLTHILVEPGPNLAESLFATGFADRVWVIRSPRTLGDASAPSAVPVPYPAVAEANLAGDTLTEYLNPKSDAFFGFLPSADFRLIQ